MAKQVINDGESGLVVRTALNSNFTELYDADGVLTTAIDTNTTAISDEETRALAAEALLAPLANPALTGVPTAPTAAVDTDTTQIATTAFVAAATDSADSLSELDDVSISGLTDADLLVYDSTTTKWENQALSGAITISDTGVSTLAGSIDAALIADGSVSDTEFQYLDGVTSDIQTQLGTNADAITAEAVTARAAEGVNADAITAEAVTARAAEVANATAISTETTRATDAEALLAPLASPTLTGVPAAPTASTGTDTTQIATTAFVTASVATANELSELTDVDLTSLAQANVLVYDDDDDKWENQALSGAVSIDKTGAATLASGIDATLIADGSVTSAEYQYLGSVTSDIQTQLDTKAPLASPSLTGTPLAPTAVVDTNTTQIATTAFVQAAVDSSDSLAELTDVDLSGLAEANVLVYDNDDSEWKNQALSGAITISDTGAATLASGIDAALVADGTVSNAEFQHLDGVTSDLQGQIDAKAPLASPTLTGVPLAPTAAAATNTTQLATTAFVTAADVVVTDAYVAADGVVTAAYIAADVVVTDAYIAADDVLDAKIDTVEAKIDQKILWTKEGNLSQNAYFDFGAVYGTDANGIVFDRVYTVTSLSWAMGLNAKGGDFTFRNNTADSTVGTISLAAPQDPSLATPASGTLTAPGDFTAFTVPADVLIGLQFTNSTGGNPPKQTAVTITFEEA